MTQGKCDQCGLYNSDDVLSCRRCGAPMPSAWPSYAAGSPDRQSRSYASAYEPEQPKLQGSSLVMFIGLYTTGVSALFLTLAMLGILNESLLSFMVAGVIEGLLYVGLAVLIRRGFQWALHITTLLYGSTIAYAMYASGGLNLDIPTCIRLAIALALLVSSAGAVSNSFRR